MINKEFGYFAWANRNLGENRHRQYTIKEHIAYSIFSLAILTSCIAAMVFVVKLLIA